MDTKKTVMAVAIAIGLALGTQARGQGFGGRGPEVSLETKGATLAILEEIEKNSELMKNIEYLCDMIGPRLTGSDKLKRANEWTRDKFKEYGLANAHLESYTIAHGWTRGTASGRVVAPTEQRLLLESAGWAPSTPGAVKGPVVHVKAEKIADLDAYKGKLKGAWVVTAEVSVQPTPRKPEPDMFAQMQRGNRPRVNFEERMKFMAALRDFLVAEGAAGLLIDSNKEHGLVNMTGATYDFTISKLPVAFLTTESFGLIWRLMKRGPVEIEIDIKNSVTDGEVEVYNTVAELPGTDKPDEVVIIGGHLDSWDLGTGATDNGTGTMAVLEAARALKAAGAKPKRTIRFILFSGEEEGLHGSKAYVKAHEKELDKISAVLVHDTGTGRVKSIGLLGRYDLREDLDKVVAPFQRELNLDELSMRGLGGGTDHASFYPLGVPAFACTQDMAEYRKTHHTESDTFDKVYPDEVNQGAKVLAAFAYNVAMLDHLLPRAPKKDGSPGQRLAAPAREEKPKATAGN
ncbi:MAG TPA: M20/M25/M40 family metallo-hydrolase [Isosphaeraceae bacterium]|nr:M20/M25/M40 family metallo-hydrolase [Isosphaeraceae bacterium]